MNRFIASLIGIVMMLSLVPDCALAAGRIEVDEKAASIGSTEYDSFEDAVDCCGADEIIILLKDAEYNMREGDCFKVNKNGFELAVTPAEDEINNDDGTFSYHFLVHHEAKEPTRSETGWEAYDSCPVCGYSTYSELPAIGWDLGDVDRNETVNVFDCSLIRRCALGLISLDEEQISLADVNGDGRVNVVDVNLVRRYAAGMITEFPIG